MIEVLKETRKVDTTWDTIIIQKWIDGKTGGKSLDLTGFTDEYLKAGHIVVEQDGKLKPAKIQGNTYAALSGAKPYGVVYKTHAPKTEGTAIMTRGKVNEKAYENWTGIKYSSEIKQALGLIEFTED